MHLHIPEMSIKTCHINNAKKKSRNIIINIHKLFTFPLNLHIHNITDIYLQSKENSNEKEKALQSTKQSSIPYPQEYIPHTSQCHFFLHNLVHTCHPSIGTLFAESTGK